MKIASIHRKSCLRERFVRETSSDLRTSGAREGGYGKIDEALRLLLRPSLFNNPSVY